MPAPVLDSEVIYQENDSDDIMLTILKKQCSHQRQSVHVGQILRTINRSHRPPGWLAEF